MSRWLSATGVGLAVVALASVAAVGALAGGVYMSDSVPEVLKPAREVTTFAVTQATFDDSRTVTLNVDRDEQTDVVSSIEGKVTTFACRPGTTLISGQSQLAVNGAATLSLGTAVPLWRDLSVGDEGADVTALQEELVRLGQPVPVTGTMNRSALTAVSALLTQAQGSQVTLTTVPASRVLWLPHASTDVEACELSVGSTVAAGDVIATVPGALQSVSLVEVPAGLVSGPRTLVVDGTPVAVDPNAPITDEPALAQLTVLPSMRSVTGEQSDAPSGRLRLSDAVQVSVVPPSAVLTDSDDPAVGCVISDGLILPVRVVGSQLGQTYVLFEGAVPSQVEVKPTSGSTCS